MCLEACRSDSRCTLWLAQPVSRWINHTSCIWVWFSQLLRSCGILFDAVYKRRSSCVNAWFLLHWCSKDRKSHLMVVTFKTARNDDIINPKIKYDALLRMEFHSVHNSHANVTWSLVVCYMMCVDLITLYDHKSNAIILELITCHKITWHTVCVCVCVCVCVSERERESSHLYIQISILVIQLILFHFIAKTFFFACFKCNIIFSLKLNSKVYSSIINIIQLLFNNCILFQLFSIDK